MDRKTKIVCTIGPATESYSVIEKIARAGMDVARLNFSHGTEEEHAERIASIRQASSALGRPLAILQDLQGPKLRVGRVPGDPLRLKKGAPFTLTTRRSVAIDSSGAEFGRDELEPALLE